MLNQNQNQTTAPTITAAELLTACERSASKAVNRNHSASGNKTMERVQNHRAADRRIEATADQLSKAATLKAKAAKLKEEAKEHRRNARTSPDKLISQAAARGETMTWEAAEAYKNSQTAEAERKAAEVDRLNKEAKKLENSAPIDNTFGDFQPLKHDAIVGYLVTQHIYQYIVTPADIITAADKATEAAERHKAATPYPALNAARSAAAIITSRPEYLFYEAWRHVAESMATTATHTAITALLHHEVNKTTKERKTIATPAIIEAWRATHGENCGKGYKVHVGRDSINWYTLEYREYKTEPTAWYLVYHWKTVSPIVSLEAYAENSHRGEAEAAEHGQEALKAARAEAEEVTPEIITNGGIPFAETQEAAERLQAIINNPNFTKRERQFTAYFISAEAAHKGQEAVNATMASKEATKAAKDEFKTAKKAEDEEVSHVDNWVELVRYRAMRRAAAEHIGIETDEAERKFFSRWRARAAEAVKVEQGCTTPEEAAEAEARYWEGMQKNRHRNTRPGEAVTVLFVGIDSPEAIQAAAAQIERRANRKHATKADKARADRAAKATKATEAAKVDPVITWNESGIAPQTMTPEEVEAMTARERAAEAARLNQYGGNIAFIECRRRMRYEAPRTPWKALNATAAAMVFLDHMTPEEQAEVMKARRAERAADTARLRAEAEKANKTHTDAWNSRKGYQITAKDWNSMEAAQRLTMLNRIHAEGMKLEFITA